MSENVFLGSSDRLWQKLTGRMQNCSFNSMSVQQTGNGLVMVLLLTVLFYCAIYTPFHVTEKKTLFIAHGSIRTIAKGAKHAFTIVLMHC